MTLGLGVATIHHSCSTAHRLRSNVSPPHLTQTTESTSVTKMPLTIIRSAPELERYTPLSTHQSQTPASFSVPVLHFRNENCKLVLTKDQTHLLPIFGDDKGATGEGDTGSEEVEVDGIDVWVTSEYALIPSPRSYPLHLPISCIQNDR